MSARPSPQPTDRFVPRLIAWETTRACPLACRHCRAAAQAEPASDELSTEEGFRLLENIAAFASPTIILTGGEPMLRPDIYDLASHARDLGLHVVMAPCGLLLNDETAKRLIESGVRHISVSLDGASAASHDAFRGVPGAFEDSLRGIAAAKRAGLGFQINTTVTQHNVSELPAILDLAKALGASVFNPFMLVPTGRGRLIADQEITPQQYEETLVWLMEQQERQDIAIRVTCAPHYQRVLRQNGRAGAASHAPKGCLGGKTFEKGPRDTNGFAFYAACIQVREKVFSMAWKRCRIMRIVSSDDLHSHGDIFCRSGERANLIQRGGEGDQTITGNMAVGGFEANNSAQRSWLPDRTSRVASKSKRNKSRSYSCRRTSRGAAGYAI